MFYFSLQICFHLLFQINFLLNTGGQQKMHEISGFAQGTTYVVKYAYAKPIVSKQAVDSIFDLMDQHFSLYKPNSSINSFNRASRYIITTNHFQVLINEANKVSTVTGGAFDITTLPLSLIWGKFNPNPVTAPNLEHINHVLAYSGYQNIYLKGDSLIKKFPSLKLDSDGIAQGYTVDVIAEYLLALDIKDFLVEVGGEIRTHGFNSNNKPWVIGYLSAENQNSYDESSSQIAISGMSVSTSGRLSKFLNTNLGKKSHIIDPRTGKTVENNIISVTVLSPKCVTADAFDNGLMVLGLDSAFKLAKTVPDIGIHLVYKSDSGEIRDTSNFFFKKYRIK
jgi:thiamine biosynthesis lipoprotein